MVKTEGKFGISGSDRIWPGDILEWLIFTFIVGLMTISFLPGLSKIMIVFGLALTWFFVLCFLHLRLPVQPEVIIYFTWVVWSIIGAFKATDLDLYRQTLTTVIQIGILIFLVSGITALRTNISIVMFAIAVGGIIVGFSSYHTGELKLAADIASKTRVAGLMGNPNTFAYHLLFMLFAAFYFWGTKRSWWTCGALLSLLGLSLVGVIYSGSRKGFVGMLAFLALWFFFCESKKVFKSPIIAITVLLMLTGVVYAITDYAMSETYLGARFERVAMQRGSESRVEMYESGFDLIRKNPIFGVGLNNYRAVTAYGMYSHSDYVEVASNTGLVGFFLYFSIYVVLWSRLNRIRSMTNEPPLLYTLGLLKAGIITILLLAFGIPNITSKITWLFLAGAIGYSWSIERALLSRSVSHK